MWGFPKTLAKLDSDSVDLCYLDPPFFAERVFEAKGKHGKINSFSDKWNRDLDSYLDSMIQVLQECHRVLRKTGSLYLHCDWHASHNLKVMCDRVFGYNKFRNEIIWHYQRGTKPKTMFGFAFDESFHVCFLRSGSFSVGSGLYKTFLMFVELNASLFLKKSVFILALRHARIQLFDDARVEVRLEP